MVKPSRRPGRPRDPLMDDALLNCGLMVMLERGYHATTLTEIARRTGVGTPAIYRRWPTKVGFAIDILDEISEPDQIPDTASIRDDLVEFVAQRLRTWSAPVFRQVVFPVLLEGLSESEVANGVGRRFLDYRNGWGARIRRSVDAGELRPDTDPGRLLDLLTGAIAMPLLFFQETPAVGDAASIVDQVLSGFAVGPKRLKST